MPRIKEINVPDLHRMLREHDNFELIDIRTRAEVERGVLPGARTLPMHMVPLKLAYFAESRKQIVVYCRTGSRSAQVCRFLSQQGIHNAISLRGGLVRWTASGYPLDPRASGAIA
ncbi:MAG: rhodanese-like domain-containing protein [Gammaproteobacteria bacterium]|jgi:rhodanese-related sulfurtransferase